MQPDETRYSLIERARNLDDSKAWDDLHNHYKNLLYYIIRQIGISQNDQDDVAQIVYQKLLYNLKNYDSSKGKFRHWLGSLVKNTALTQIRKKSTKKESPNHRVSEDIEVENLHLPTEDEIESLVDKEWKTYILKIALERIKKSYTGHAVSVFEMDLDGMESSEIAEKLNIKINTVYSLRRRIKQSMIFEIQEVVREIDM